MKMKLLLPTLAASAAFAFVSCAENPADNVPKADVTEPAEEAKPAEEPTSSTPAETSGGVAYVFTPASTIGFVGSKVTGSHEGGFKKFNGNFSVAGDKPGAGPHTIVIDMNSVWSDNEKLTGHLKSADFFEVETYPKSTFTVTGVEPGEEPDSYKLSGTLEMHGTTKAIAFPAMVKKTASGDVSLDAEFAINRKDFGIDYPGKADDLIRDEVVIKLAMVAAPK